MAKLKMPTTLGATIDLLWSLREERKAADVIVNEIKEARSQSRYSLARAARRRLLFTLDVFHMVHQQPYRMYRRSQQARSLNDCSA